MVYSLCGAWPPLLVCVVALVWGVHLPSDDTIGCDGTSYDEVSLLQLSAAHSGSGVASRQVLKRRGSRNNLRIKTDTSYQDFIDILPVWRARVGAFTDEKFGAPRALKLPLLLRSFDWVLYPGSGQDAIIKTEDPTSVLVYPSNVSTVLNLAEEQWDDSHNDRFLVIGGEDDFATRMLGVPGTYGHNETLKALRRYFKNIFYEALDAEMEGVRVAPIALTEHYLRRNQEAGADAIFRASTDAASKFRPVLAAWGYYWSDVENKTDQGESRREAAEWANTLNASLSGVDVREIPEDLWWGELATYRFMMSPDGNGIQSPKMIEALLVLTIPILQRTAAADDLVRFGFPVVVVDNWNEITPESLAIWWSRLEPRLWNFRNNCISTDAYMMFFNGTMTSCE